MRAVFESSVHIFSELRVSSCLGAHIRTDHILHVRYIREPSVYMSHLQVRHMRVPKLLPEATLEEAIR